MAISKLHTLAAVSLYTDAMATAEQPAVVLGGTKRQMIRTGADVRQETTAGNVYPMFQSLYAVMPQAEFGTYHVASAMDAIGVTGVRVAATGGTATGLKYFGSQKQEGGGRTSGSTHVCWTTREGLLLPRRLRCSHRGDAMLELENLITYDGTNEPLVLSENSPQPTNPGDSERFTIGKIVLGTSGGDSLTLTSKVDVDIDFGLRAQTYGSDSDLYDTIATIDEIQRAMLTIRILDVSLLKTASGIPLTGKGISYAVSQVMFRKRGKTASGFVADNTAEHLLFTPGYGLAIQESVFDASEVENGIATIQIPLCGDTSVWPWSVDTTATIS